MCIQYARTLYDVQCTSYNIHVYCNMHVHYTRTMHVSYIVRHTMYVIQYMHTLYTYIIRRIIYTYIVRRIIYIYDIRCTSNIIRIGNYWYQYVCIDMLVYCTTKNVLSKPPIYTCIDSGSLVLLCVYDAQCTCLHMYRHTYKHTYLHNVYSV